MIPFGVRFRGGSKFLSLSLSEENDARAKMSESHIPGRNQITPGSRFKWVFFFSSKDSEGVFFITCTVV